MTEKNSMRKIRISKLTLNMGVGNDASKMENAITVLTQLTGKKPVKTSTQKRIPGWGLRPGIPIGVKVTVRGKEAEELLSKLFVAIDNKLNEKSFDDFGNFSFGVPEHIEIPGQKYDPKIGIVGMDVSVNLQRPGFRVMVRRLKSRKLPKHSRISKEEAISYLKEKGIVVE